MADKKASIHNSAQPAHSDGQSKATPDVLIGLQLPDSRYNYTEKDVIIYALAVGVSTRQPDFLKFLHEINEDFCALPTYAGVSGQGMMSKIIYNQGLPYDLDRTQIVHGEHYLELFKPVPVSGSLTIKSSVTEVLDKGRGTAIVVDAHAFDEYHERVSINQFIVYVQNLGGWGGRRDSAKVHTTQAVPRRPPDACIVEATGVDQAQLFRLATIGDVNPIHVDPGFAAKGGFPDTILHGHCLLGISAKHILKQYCDNDVTQFKAIKVRFSKPVFPGQTLRTKMWKEGRRIHFQTEVVDNGSVCITGAYVDLVA